MLNRALLCRDIPGAPEFRKTRPPVWPTKWPWRTTPVGKTFFAPGYRGRPDQEGDGPVLATYHARKIVPGSRWTRCISVKDGVCGVLVRRVA